MNVVHDAYRAVHVSTVADTERVRAAKVFGSELTAACVITYICMIALYLELDCVWLGAGRIPSCMAIVQIQNGTGYAELSMR